MKKLFLTLLAAVLILPAAADNVTDGQNEPEQFTVSVVDISSVVCGCGCEKAGCTCSMETDSTESAVMEYEVMCCGGECCEECTCECTDELCNCYECECTCLECGMMPVDSLWESGGDEYDSGYDADIAVYDYDPEYNSGYDADLFELSDDYNWDSAYDSDSDSGYGDFNRFKMAGDFFDGYGHWAGIALTYNGMVSSLSNLNLPPELSELAQSPRSIGISINLIDAAMPIFGRNLSLITGLGLEVNNFRFSRDVGLIKDDSGFTVVDTSFGDAGINLRKSKLTTSYIVVPLLMELQFRNGIFLNGGVVGAYRLSSHTKIKARDPQLRGIFKDRSNITMPNFRYGYTVTAGIKNIGITATYYPQSIFVKNTGPDTKQVNIGLLFTW